VEQFYQNMLSFIRQHPHIKRNILFITHYFSYITFCLYSCTLIYLYIAKSPFLFESIWKPLTAFLIVTIFRKIINRLRPYDVYNIVPLVEHKHGESFPSRHTVSAFIIAFICLHVHFYLGIFALLIATIISVSRILCGVHYISDVIVSVIIAVMIYFI